MAIVRALVLSVLAVAVLFLLPPREAEHSAWAEPDDGIQPVDPYVLSATKVAAEAQAVWYPTMAAVKPGACDPSDDSAMLLNFAARRRAWTATTGQAPASVAIGSTLHRTH